MKRIFLLLGLGLALARADETRYQIDDLYPGLSLDQARDRLESRYPGLRWQALDLEKSRLMVATAPGMAPEERFDSAGASLSAPGERFYLVLRRHPIDGRQLSEFISVVRWERADDSSAFRTLESYARERFGEPSFQEADRLSWCAQPIGSACRWPGVAAQLERGPGLLGPERRVALEVSRLDYDYHAEVAAVRQSQSGLFRSGR